MTELQQRYRQNAQVVATELDETEAVLLHLDNQRYYTLNETGWFIWRQLKEGASIEEVVARLQNNYDIDSEKALGSVTSMLNELYAERLVDLLNGEAQA